MEEEKKKLEREKVSINFKAAPLFRKMIEEIGNFRGGMNQTETIKFCVSEYYYGQFRKQTIGYFSGTKTHANRMKREDINRTIDALENMNDKELTAYIHTIGLITPEDEELGTFFAHTDEATGIRMIAFKYHDQTSFSDRWTINELKKELEKHLKELNKSVS